jgi:4-carboxymuconolactone decarboxylase
VWRTSGARTLPENLIQKAAPNVEGKGTGSYRNSRCSSEFGGSPMSLPPRIDLNAVRERIGPYADKTSFEDRTDVYRDLIGFLPPRTEARIAVTGAIDPALLELQEKMRERAMSPKCFDVKITQLMLFGMLLMDLRDAAQLHAIAARNAGASWEEMHAVVSLCFLFRGLPAANRGAEILANVAKRETDVEAD